MASNGFFYSGSALLSDVAFCQISQLLCFNSNFYFIVAENLDLKQCDAPMAQPGRAAAS